MRTLVLNTLVSQKENDWTWKFIREILLKTSLKLWLFNTSNKKTHRSLTNSNPPRNSIPVPGIYRFKLQNLLFKLPNSNQTTSLQHRAWKTSPKATQFQLWTKICQSHLVCCSLNSRKTELQTWKTQVCKCVFSPANILLAKLPWLGSFWCKSWRNATFPSVQFRLQRIEWLQGQV